MDNLMKGLLWAIVVLAFAWISKTNGMSDGASFGIIAGLSAAAIASLNNQRTKSKGCN